MGRAKPPHHDKRQLLSTQQAADLLQVTRQYVMKLLEKGQLSHIKIGHFRWCKVEDVLAYKLRRSAARDVVRKRKISALVKLYTDDDEG